MKPLAFSHDANMRWSVEAQTLTTDRYNYTGAAAFPILPGTRFIRVTPTGAAIWLKGQATNAALSAPGAVTDGTSPDYLPANAVEYYSVEGEAFLVTTGACLITVWSGAS